MARHLDQSGVAHAHGIGSCGDRSRSSLARRLAGVRPSQWHRAGTDRTANIAAPHDRGPGRAPGDHRVGQGPHRGHREPRADRGRNAVLEPERARPGRRAAISVARRPEHHRFRDGRERRAARGRCGGKGAGPNDLRGDHPWSDRSGLAAVHPRQQLQAARLSDTRQRHEAGRGPCLRHRFPSADASA